MDYPVFSTKYAPILSIWQASKLCLPKPTPATRAGDNPVNSKLAHESTDYIVEIGAPDGRLQGNRKSI